MPTSGQAIVDAIRIDLGPLANAFTVDQLLYFANRGVQQVWMALRSMDQDYFGDASQSLAPKDENYFATLSTSSREYPLPANCREPRFIEVLSVGFEDRTIVYKKFEDPVFQASRRQSTANGPGGGQNSGGMIGEYYYTILGTKLILAQYPEAALQVKIWYVKAIDVITIEASPEILDPFTQFISDYAVERAVKSTRNLEIDSDWMETWKNDVLAMATSAGERTSTDPIFISDYLGS